MTYGEDSGMKSMNTAAGGPPLDRPTIDSERPQLRGGDYAVLPRCQRGHLRPHIPKWGAFVALRATFAAHFPMVAGRTSRVGVTRNVGATSGAQAA